MRSIDHVLTRPALPLAAAGVVLVLALTALFTAAVVARGAQSSGIATVVVPPRADQGADAGPTAQAPPAAAGSAAVTSDRAAVAAPAVQNAVATLPIVGPTCSAAPTVQFQGRGLAATGLAPILPGEPGKTGMALSVSLQQTGGDAATVIAAVQARLSAIEAALRRAGVPAANIQRTYFSTYGGSPKQSAAYATIQAQLGADQLAAATAAVMQVDGVTSYSTSTSAAAQPTQQELQAATAVATSQATDMAISMARTAGVKLGDVVGIVTQPPTVCYGGGAPSRVVQVTVTYALR